MIHANSKDLYTIFNLDKEKNLLKKMSFEQIQKDVETTKLRDFINVKLSFERFYDFSTKEKRVNFVPFYYQEEIEVQGKMKSVNP